MRPLLATSLMLARLSTLLFVGAIAVEPCVAEETPTPPSPWSIGLMGGFAWSGRDPTSLWGGIEVQLRPLEHLAVQVDAAYRHQTRGVKYPDDTWVEERLDDRSLGATLVGIVGGPPTEVLLGAGLGLHFKTAFGSCCTETLIDGHLALSVSTHLATRVWLLGGARYDVLPGADRGERVDTIMRVFVGVHFCP